VEWSAFAELPYTLYLVSSYFFFWSVYIGFYYVGSFGRDRLGVSQATSINLLLTMNGVGLVARVLPNYIAERWTGPMNLMIPYTAATAIVLFAWTGVDSPAGLWVWAVVYGVVASGIHSLFPVVLTSLTDDAKKLGVRSGMGFSVVGCAVLTGPPIAGALVQRMNGSYLGLQLFAGITMLIALVFLLAARWAKVGGKLKAKL
jgi:predicted MFS family arabinose efflux permease